jgi:hypothetical protein
MRKLIALIALLTLSAGPAIAQEFIPYGSLYNPPVGPTYSNGSSWSSYQNSATGLSTPSALPYTPIPQMDTRTPGPIPAPLPLIQGNYEPIPSFGTTNVFGF